MEKLIFRAETRGKADYGWLKANYYFSFANYYDPRRIHFGLLRVVNDDFVEGGMGFPEHPHDNMEIITIPHSGKIAHQDSTGGKGVITAGEVQVMSAGSGVTHSEFNGSETEALTLFQIWIFPNKKNVTPRYDQKKFDEAGRKNKFQLLVSNDGRNHSLMIHQDAFLSLVELDVSLNSTTSVSASSTTEERNITYKNFVGGNGIFVIVVEGEISIEGENLKRRDAIGISEVDTVEISASENAKVLVIEVPIR